MKSSDRGFSADFEFKSVTGEISPSQGFKPGACRSAPDGGPAPPRPGACAACRRIAAATPQASGIRPAAAQAPKHEALLADRPVRDFSFTGLFNGAPDLSERLRRSCESSRSALMLIADGVAYGVCTNVSHAR